MSSISSNNLTYSSASTYSKFIARITLLFTRYVFSDCCVLSTSFKSLHYVLSFVKKVRALLLVPQGVDASRAFLCEQPCQAPTHLLYCGVALGASPLDLV